MAKKKAKRKSAKKRSARRTRGTTAEAAAAGNGRIVARHQVGTTVQAMISFDNATQVEAIEQGGGMFRVTQLA